MDIDSEKHFLVSKDVLFQEVSGEIVLLDLDSENYFGLDEVGARIWMLLKEGKSASQMVDVLLEEYRVDRQTLERDTEKLLTALLEAGLVEQ